jgi:hypothetical protein
MEQETRILQMVLEFALMVIGMGCATGVITSWFKHRRLKAGQSPEILARLDDISERLSRLDNSVDAMAVEVERISEGQRFTSRLLAERAGAPAPTEKGRPGGSTTPH